LSDYLEALGRTAFGIAPKSTQALREASEGFDKVGKVPSAGNATLSDHLADIQAASQRFGDTSPAQATAAWLAGVGATGLLGRLLAGERLVGQAAARATPELVAPLVRRLGPEFAERVAPATAQEEPAAVSAAAKTDLAASPSLAKAESAPATNAASGAETAPEAVAQLPTEPDVAYQTYLLRKTEGTGRKRHIREANENYLKATEDDPGLALAMSKLGIKIERTPRGKVPWKPPEGWTWHHHPHDEGLMQLMPRSQHESPQFQAILHPFKYGGGGHAKWGQYYLHIPGAATGGIWLTQHPDAEAEGGAQEQEYD
jgi:hypothetical protein